MGEGEGECRRRKQGMRQGTVVKILQKSKPCKNIFTEKESEIKKERKRISHGSVNVELVTHCRCGVCLLRRMVLRGSLFLKLDCKGKSRQP